MPTFEDIASLRAKLEDVEQAIAAARAGSSYSIGGRSVTRQALEDLNTERSRLRREIKRTAAYLEGVRDPSVAIATWTDYRERPR